MDPASLVSSGVKLSVVPCLGTAHRRAADGGCCDGRVCGHDRRSAGHRGYWARSVGEWYLAPLVLGLLSAIRCHRKKKRQPHQRSAAGQRATGSRIACHAGAAVPLEALTSQGGAVRFCEDLQKHGFAIVRSPEALKHREGALRFLESFAEFDRQASDLAIQALSRATASPVRFEECIDKKLIDVVPCEVVYLIDNSKLNAPSRGLCYHLSKQPGDIDLTNGAKWGSVVRGEEQGDGWLKVGSRYLAMESRGTPVVVPLEYNNREAMEPSGIQSLAALTNDLHKVALRCLRALAADGLAGLESLVAPLDATEQLGAAREPCLLRVNMYPGDSVGWQDEREAGRSTTPSWHMDNGLLTVAPAANYAALMASPKHLGIGPDSFFLEELLDPSRDMLVFPGTTLALASGGRYTAMVHGVNRARVAEAKSPWRVSMPYFLRARRGAEVLKPAHLDNQSSWDLLYPAVVEAETRGRLDLLQFHADVYNRLVKGGEVVPLPQLVEQIALGLMRRRQGDGGGDAAGLVKKLEGFREAPRRLEVVNAERRALREKLTRRGR
eukprot:TRINITY_DN23990_c0_g1_i1.p1 TRINITY_DN23990_c0_g1~~TRINITY_DN23990_c0_g1_i1.p1  ORF type:complete len:570 (+),score=92.85 TRINITY_DN23990_c0_g1_i1:52-1710(+)